MPRIPNTLEDVFEGEHSAVLIEAIHSAISKAQDDEKDLQIECRLEPRGGRSHQTQAIPLHVSGPAEPIPEAVVQELHRHYADQTQGGFRGTLRVNMRQKGNSQVVYESFQRSVIVPSEEEEDEFYGGGGGFDAPAMDLTLGDPDEEYIDDAPRGVLSPGRVGGLTAKHADYMFLPLYQETIATAERRTDALLRSLIEGQTALVEMHRSATESNTTIMERLLERLPRGAMLPGEEPEPEGRSRDKGISDWLGSMLISQVKKSVLGTKKAAKVAGPPAAGGLNRPSVEAPAYDGWGEAPTFGVPAVHQSEWGEEIHAPDDFGGPPSTVVEEVDLIGEIRRMSSQNPSAFKALVQENSDELLPVFMDALDDEE